MVKHQQEVDEATAALDQYNTTEAHLQEQLNQLTQEAQEAAATKQELENQIRQQLAPIRNHQQQLNSVKLEYNAAERRLASARKHLQDARDQIMQLSGSAQSDEARRTARIREAEAELAEQRTELEERKRNLQEYHDEYEETEPHVEQAKNNWSGAMAQLHAVTKRVNDLTASEENSMAVFEQKCVAVHSMVSFGGSC